MRLDYNANNDVHSSDIIDGVKNVAPFVTPSEAQTNPLKKHI